MSTPPQHLSGRTLAPGALLALLVTSAALFALAVVIAVGPDGPARLWLDGGGSSTTLQARGGSSNAFTFPGGPAGLLPGSTSALDGDVSLASPVVAAERPGAVRLRSTTRVQRRAAARTPAAGRPSPNRTAPAAATPSPLQPASRPATSSPAPVSSPAPGSTVVKSYGRGSSPESVSVPKQRVPNRSAAAAPPSSSESPPSTQRAAPAPAPATQPTRAVPPPASGTGDSGLTRVPPTHP